MKKIYLVLGVMVLAMVQAFSQTISITSLASPYQQDFNTLANTGTNANTTLPAGWLMSETGTGANTTYVADNGASNTGNTYSYGTTASTERAFGCLQSGSLIPTIGAGFTNNSGATITSITVTYTGEQWRLGTLSRLDRMDFQYSLDATGLTTGIYTDVDALDFAAPVTTGTAGALDGNALANKTLISFTITGLSIANGSSFYIRWNDLNATSSDDGLAVDDLSMNFNGAVLPACVTPAAQPGALSFSSVTTSSMNVSFAAATPAPDQYLAVISTNPTLGGAPVDGTTYNVDDQVGNGTVVFIGNTTSFSATSLNPGTTYYYTIFSVSNNCTGGPLYKTDIPATGNQLTASPPACVAPVTQVSGVVFSTITNSTLGGSFTAAGDADSYLVCYSLSNTLGFSPVNGVSYTVGQTVGSGKVTKIGPGTTFSQGGLAANTNYYFYFFPYNNSNCTGGPLYNSTAFTANASTNNSSSGIPAGYYDAISGQTCSTIKTLLKTRTITGMTPKNYGNLWTQYVISDIKPGEAATNQVTGSPYNYTGTNVIWDIYSDIPGANNDPYQFIPTTNQCGNYSNEAGCYNREHSVPQNWFGGNANSGSVGPESDYFHIYPTDGKVNGQRSNYIYGEVSSPTWTSKNGSKLGPNAFAGLTGIAFEPIDEYKGDLARSFLYFVTRYEDNMSGWTGGTNGGQAFEPNTYPSVDVPYLKLMIKWHNQDPVSQKEIDRNNAAFSFQGNRNPYIDHPEYVDMVWNPTCPGLSALPVDIISFKGFLKGASIQLEWEVMNEQNLLQYEVERSVNGRDFYPVGTVKASNAGTYHFNDDVTQLSGRRLYYRLKKVDVDGKFKYSLVFTAHVPLNLQFSVYPNPVADGFAQVKFVKPTTGNARLLVSDMAGRAYQQVPVATGTTNMIVSLKNAPAGMYIIKLVQDGNTVMQKIQVY